MEEHDDLTCDIDPSLKVIMNQSAGCQADGWIKTTWDDLDAIQEPTALFPSRLVTVNEASR